MKNNAKKHKNTYLLAIKKAELLARYFYSISLSDLGNERYTAIIKILLSELHGCNDMPAYRKRVKQYDIRSRFTKVVKNSKYHGQGKRT